MKVAIIGAGRLGTCLASALKRIGYTIQALADCDPLRGRESAEIVGAELITTDNLKAAIEGEVVFLSVPDEKIEVVVRELSTSGIDFTSKYVFHCSGLLPADVLRPLQARGALIGSFHPVQSFPQKRASPRRWQDIFIGIEGEKKALSLARIIVKKLGARSLILHGKKKAVYHAACSVASNFLTVLVDIGVSLLRDIGIAENKALRILMPVIEGTLQNVKKLGTQSALTGPIVRADALSVERHLQALKKHSLYRQIYLLLAQETFRIARKKGLPASKVRALKKLLEGK